MVFMPAARKARCPCGGVERTPHVKATHTTLVCRHITAAAAAAADAAHCRRRLRCMHARVTTHVADSCPPHRTSSAAHARNAGGLRAAKGHEHSTQRVAHLEGDEQAEEAGDVSVEEELEEEVRWQHTQRNRLQPHRPRVSTERHTTSGSSGVHRARRHA